jgi:glycosyltransferase involved in cell wall biosynthesis
MIRYVMVSSEIRRDLEHPLTGFRRIEVHHLYNRAGWNDMLPSDFGPHTRRFTHPVNLFRQLARIKPHVIQGPEPLSIRMFPYLLAVFVYLLQHPDVSLVCMSQETIPLRRKYGWLGESIMRPVLRRWFARAGVLLWLDESSRANMLTLGAPAHKLRYMLYGCWGVDLREFRPEGPVVRLSEHPVILCVARLSPEKGINNLIEAYRLVRQSGIACTLAIIGDGKSRAALVAQAQATGYGDDIIFLGTKKHAELPAYLRGAYVLTLPSIRTRLWVQHISMITWHAMACALPVIVTDVGEMRRYTPEGTGMLVPERDPEALALALTQILHDPELRASMSRQALRYARETFDLETNIRAVEQMIIDLARTSIAGERSYAEMIGER